MEKTSRRNMLKTAAKGAAVAATGAAIAGKAEAQVRQERV